MARAYLVRVGPGAMPDRAALQHAVKAAGFALTVDPGWVPFETADYLPCTLEGEDAGVYVRFAGQPDALGEVQLRWGGDVREQLAATILATALAEACAAQVLEGEQALDVSALKAHAKRLHAQAFQI